MSTINAIGSQDPIQVTFGGTGVATMTTAYAPVFAGTTATGPLQVSATGQSNSGYVLTSTGSSSLPTFQAAPSGGIVTIDGDSGSVTGSTVTIAAGVSTQNCGSTVSFTGSSSTLTMNITDSNNNTILGLGSGNASITGNFNVGIGGYESGFNTLGALGSGSNNVCIGIGSGTAISSSSGNVCIGTESGYVLATGTGNNSFMGYLSGSQIATGSNNAAIGYNSGTAWTTTESNNIALGCTGTIGDSSNIMIGVNSASSDSSATYIGNIYNTSNVISASSPLYSVSVNSNGKLGSGAPGAITTLTITLTNSQIKALHATPITLIASAGSGKTIVILNTYATLNYGGSNVFTAGASQIIKAYYTNTSGAVAITTVVPNTMITASASQSFYAPMQTFSAGGVAITSLQNQAIVLANSVATEITGNAAANNTITVFVTYQVMNT